MATILPDPREFKSWEDAFAYPLPAVRKLEQQLRSNAVENRERLRSVVGASYRDLLGTAERICEMDEKMQVIEATLGQTAKDCNSSAVERRVRNAGTVDVQGQSRQALDKAHAAQLSLLNSCYKTMSSRLGNHASPYGTAKILVLARLLHKSLSLQPDAPSLVDSLRDRIATLRLRLLKRINHNYGRLGLDEDALVDNLAAYSLAMSASHKDVLSHFLSTRRRAIQGCANLPTASKIGMVRSIKLLKTSLKVVQTMFPARLSELMGRLRSQRLLQDPEILSAQELNLDIYGRWVPDEIRNFTPYLRHDELQTKDVDEILRSWAPSALAALRAALDTMLAKGADLAKIMQLRQDVIEVHLSSNISGSGIDAAEILDLIRDVFNRGLQTLVRQTAGGLRSFLAEVDTSLNAEAVTSEEQAPSLWSMTTDPPALDNGGVDFKNLVSSTYHGHSPLVSSCIKKLEQWRQDVLSAQALIKGMSERRWDDDFLESDEADFDIDSQQILLSEDDPRDLRDALVEALQTTLQDFVTGFERLSLIAGNVRSAQAMFLIRVLRAAFEHIWDLGLSDKVLEPFMTEASTLARPLMNGIAVAVSKSPVEDFHKALGSSLNKSSRSDVLWEGQPPLPVQPSPAAFRLPHSLSKAMSAAGADLWDAMLVAQVKRCVERQLCSELEGTIESMLEEGDDSIKATNGVHDSEDPSSSIVKEELVVGQETSELNGSAESEPATTRVVDEEVQEEDQPVAATTVRSSEEESKVQAVQLLFDLLYLAVVLRVNATLAVTKNEPDASLKEIAARLSQKIEFGEHLVKIEKNAREYWRRTYLFIGILA